MNEFLKRDLREETIWGWKEILGFQRELVLFNPVKNKPCLLETLHGMAAVSFDFGDEEQAIECVTEAAEICRELVSQVTTPDVARRLTDGLHRVLRPSSSLILYPRG